MVDGDIVSGAAPVPRASRELRGAEEPGDSSARRWPGPRALAWLLPVVVVVLALLVGGISGVARVLPGARASQPDDPPATRAVRVLVASRTSVSPVLVARGVVQAPERAVLSAAVAGRVVWRSPDLVAGGSFEAGDILARLDDTTFELDVAQARSGAKQRQIELRRARHELKQVSGLVGQGAVRRDRMLEAQDEAALAAARVQSANTELRRARVALERTELRAPFSGRVGTVQLELGQAVPAGTSLAALQGRGRREVRLAVRPATVASLGLDPVTLASDLAPGPSPGSPGLQVVAVATLPGSGFQSDPSSTPTAERNGPGPGPGAAARWRGRVVRVEAERDPQTRQMIVVAEFGAPPGSSSGDDVGAELPVGAFVEVELRVPAQRTDVFVLPSAAVDSTDRVWVVEDQRAVPRQVTVRRRGDAEVWIDSGLAEGDSVLRSPPPDLRTGDPVRVRTEAGQVSE